MSLNPQLDEQGIPILHTGDGLTEKIELNNTNIEFEIRVEPSNPKSQILKGAGVLYLTNFRIILVNINQNEQLKAFSIKNYKVYKEELPQGKNSSNNFHGLIKTYNEMFKQDLEFKIEFKNEI